MTSTIRHIAAAVIGSMVMFSAAQAETPAGEDFAAHLAEMHKEVSLTVGANATAMADRIAENAVIAEPENEQPQYYAQVEFMTAATDYAFVMSKYQFYPVTAN